jgi:hypothetical protein
VDDAALAVDIAPLKRKPFLRAQPRPGGDEGERRAELVSPTARSILPSAVTAR